MDEISSISGNKNIVNKKNISKIKNDKFQKTLKNILEKKEASNLQKLNTASLGEINVLNLNRVEYLSFDLLGHSDQLLTMLDDYTNKLNDPDKSLKDIAPFISDIKIKALTLMEEINSDPKADENIKQYVSQCALVANNEAMRFERGDYL